MYFDYLDALIDLSRAQGLGFEVLDRALYVFDKSKNGPLKAAKQ